MSGQVQAINLIVPSTMRNKGGVVERNYDGRQMTIWRTASSGFEHYLSGVRLQDGFPIAAQITCKRPVKWPKTAQRCAWLDLHDKREGLFGFGLRIDLAASIVFARGLTATICLFDTVLCLAEHASLFFAPSDKSDYLN